MFQRITALFTACLLLTGSLAAPAQPPQSDKEKLSYTIGVQMGRNILNQLKVLDRESLLQGLDDTLAGKDPQLSEEEMRDTLTRFRQAEMDKQQEMAETNKQQGEDFLAANAEKEGVHTHPSGLQYRIISKGNGKSPAPGDTVTVNYEGRLIDGTVFDSSYERGQPVTLQLDRVIEGWKIALPLMSVGAKWQLFLPPELAYGDKAAGPDIQPNSVLVFDVELLSVE